MTGTGRVAAAVGLVVALSLVPSAAAAPAAASAHEDDRSFLVELETDGSATVTLTLAYDLESDEERAAFTALQDSASSRETARTRFRDRM